VAVFPERLRQIAPPAPLREKSEAIYHDPGSREAKTRRWQGAVLAALCLPFLFSAALAQGGQDLRRAHATLERYLELGHRYLDVGRLEEAAAAYRRVLGVDGQDPEALTHMGIILFLEGRVNEAIANYDRAIERNPHYAHAWWDKGVALCDGRGDHAAAIKVWEALLKLLPPKGPEAEAVLRRIEQAKGHLRGEPHASAGINRSPQSAQRSQR